MSRQGAKNALLLGTLLGIASVVGCGDGGDGGDGETKRIDLEITGCAELVTGQSLLIRIEGADSNNEQCTVVERCLEGALVDASAADIANRLRSQGFPLFDVAASEVNRVTVAVSAVPGCGLEILTAGCGSAPLTGASPVVVDIDCDQASCANLSTTCATAHEQAPPEGAAWLEVDVAEALVH